VKLPLSWLSSHVDHDLEVDALVDVMSAHGLEVEAVTRPGAGTAGVRTARVLAYEPHPDADSLRVVRVSDGDGEIELVCGAANFDVGDVVAHAVVGASIPGMRMEARSIRGVVSNGMLCSARELELGDDHSGILVLPPDTPLGVELTEIVPLGEPVIEIAVQPDRGDHLGVVGVARDLAAILDTSWRPPDTTAPLDAPTIPVAIETDGCARFVTWSLEDVEVRPSPPWLRARLAQCGVRPIDVVVDVTNFVMLELGQPLHAFDLATIRGPRLEVRHAREGERLTTLDDVERTLVDGDLVIADAERLVSLAGVMGGLDTEVTGTTSSVLVEAAVWDPKAIRATSRRLGLVSEASTRFERRVDPAGADRAAARAAGLLVELAGARAAGTGVEAPPARAWSERASVTLDTARVRRLLGIDDLSDETQRELLVRAGCDVEGADGGLAVRAPSWRGDLMRPADLAEEIARLHGYDRIPTAVPAVRTTGGLPAAARLVRTARGVALAAGFHEAVTRPFVGEGALLGVAPSDGRVALANPLAKDAAAMRPTLVEGLLQAVRRNVGQGRPGTALVEIGRVFRPVDDALADLLDAFGDDWRWRAPDGAELPVQPRTIGLVAQGQLTGARWLDPDSRWSVEDLFAVFDEVVARLLPGGDSRRLERQPVERPGFHPGRTARLLLDGREIGLAGALHPREADRRDLPEPVVVGEMLLEPLLAAVPDSGHPPVHARRLVRHPALTVDVAIIAPDELPYARLEAAIREAAGELLDEWWWFDEYRGEQVGAGRRSVAIRLRLQDANRQLTDADAEQVIEAVASEVERIGGALRR
jgi:phenylalanyl-tRNA synthetase beta chain